MTLTKPKADFLTAMTLIPFAMQSPTALQAHHADLGSKDPTNDYWQKAPTGTGPFMFSEFVPGDHYTIVKNPNYWDTANAAHLDKIIFQPIADSANRLTALKSGTVDTIDFVDATQLKDISSDPTLQLLTRPPLDIGKLAFNQPQKPFNDIKVRKAAALAIDKAALVSAFFPNGAGTVADSDLINNMPAYEPNATITGFDATKAKTMLQSSSCPPPCAITFWYPDSVSRPYMLDPKGEYEAIKPMLEAAGFVVTPNHKPWHGGYLTDEANGVYPMFFIGWIYDYADPADGPGLFYATSTADCNGVKQTDRPQLRVRRGQSRRRRGDGQGDQRAGCGDPDPGLEGRHETHQRGRPRRPAGVGRLVPRFHHPRSRLHPQPHPVRVLQPRLEGRRVLTRGQQA